MKKMIIVFGAIVFLSFFYLKWEEIKYYLKSDIAKISILDNNIDFGKIAIQDSTLIRFQILNIGKNDLKVKQVVPSCECTVINLKEKVVATGDTLFVDVIFKPEQKGNIKKDIVLELNTAPPFNVLSVVGEVVK